MKLPNNHGSGWVALLLAGVVLAAGCSNRSEAKDKTTDASRKEQSAEKRDPRGMFGGRGAGELKAVPVEVTPLTRGDIASYLLYSAPLETEQTVTVFSRIQGLVEKIFVEEGQHVKRNQPLLQLEQREYQLAEERARLEFERQQANFKRLQALQTKNLVSEEEFENARLQMKQAEIAWKEARLNLDYTVIRSPIDGVVGERMVNLGDRIQPANSLFVISNLSEKVVKLHIPQDDLKKCYKGQKALVLTEVLPDRRFEGWVKRISPIIDAQSGTFKVTVGVRDPRNELRPGMYVQVQLIEDTHENVPLVPKMALIYENERRYLFILHGDTALKVQLRSGYEDAEKVELLNPIKTGTPVVVLGQNGLRDGTLVKVTATRRFDWQKEVKAFRVSRREGERTPGRRRPAAKASRPHRPGATMKKAPQGGK